MSGLSDADKAKILRARQRLQANSTNRAVTSTISTVLAQPYSAQLSQRASSQPAASGQSASTVISRVIQPMQKTPSVHISTRPTGTSQSQQASSAKITSSTHSTVGRQPQQQASASQSSGMRRMMPVQDQSSEILGKRKLEDMLQQISPHERLDADVADVLLEMADDFIESTTVFASQLAKHRKSNTLDAHDLKLHLEKNWGMRIPGFGPEAVRAFKRPKPDIHEQRLALIKRTAAFGLAHTTRE